VPTVAITSGFNWTKWWHSGNFNVLEYFERRLDDYAHVIGSIILQCEQQSASDDLNQLLYLVHEEVSG